MTIFKRDKNGKKYILKEDLEEEMNFDRSLRWLTWLWYNNISAGVRVQLGDEFLKDYTYAPVDDGTYQLYYIMRGSNYVKHVWVKIS